MILSQVTDIPESVIVRTKYDVGFFASGYEERCTSLPRRLDPRNIRQAAVIGFQELSDNSQRTERDAYFKNTWKLDPILTKASDDLAISHFLNSNGFGVSETIRILVDCSSMSRLWYAGLFNWARYSEQIREVHIDIAYSLGIYSPTYSQMVIDDILMVPGCEGIPSPTGQTVAVFGLGFNGWASECVLERLEPDEAYALIAEPGADPEYPDHVRQLNKDFLDDARVREHILLSPLRSIEACFRLLSEVISPFRLKDSIILVPMGPKPHVVASLLIAMRFPEIGCMRVSAVPLKPEEVKPTGEFIAARAIFRKED